MLHINPKSENYRISQLPIMALPEESFPVNQANFDDAIDEDDDSNPW